MFRVRVENLSRKGPQNRRSLGFARDDKGKGCGYMESSGWTEDDETAFPFSSRYH